MMVQVLVYYPTMDRRQDWYRSHKHLLVHCYCSYESFTSSVVLMV